MVSMEVGRVCMKIAGREAGKYCVIVKKVNEAFVEVTGPKILTGVKRRRANIEHLEPLEYIIQINENADDEAVTLAYKTQNLLSKLELKMPSSTEIKAYKAKPEKEIKEGKKETKKEEKKESKEKPKKEDKEKKEKKK